MKFRKKDKEEYFTHSHLEDVERMLRVCTERGIDTDLRTCAFLWDYYSERFAAGWLSLFEDDDLLFTTIFITAESNNHLKGIDI